MIEHTGYFSMVRFNPDIVRGESRNVAVVVVGDTPGSGAVKSAPLSRIAPKAREAGVLDGILKGFAAAVGSGRVSGLEGLRLLAASSPSVLSLSTPRPIVLTSEPAQAAEDLYREYVGVPTRREPRRKGEILDRLMASMARSGASVERNAYAADFAIDALVGGPRPAAIQVLSFCVGESRGITVEREAGHFLFGLERLSMAAHSVLQPPEQSTGKDLWVSHDRVQRWLDDARVETVRPSDIDRLADRYGGVIQLPLAYASVAT